MSQFQRFRLAAVFCVLGWVVAPLGSSFGDDAAVSKSAVSKPKGNKPAADAPDKPAADETPQKPDPLAEWKKLSERKIAIARQLRKLQVEFNRLGTTKRRKREIQDDFRRLVGEFRLEVEAKMGERAAAVYEANPDDVEAAEAVMESAFNNTHYQRALDVAKRLLESDRQSQYAGNLAINIAGAASFSLNEFEQAEAYFKAAQEKKQLNDQYGERYLEHLPAYLEFWKKEQAIRAREAKLKGDEQLPMVELTIGSGGKELGKVVIELFENEAPNTVANFIHIVESEEQNYNGVKFHRVLPNFMSQTGNLEASGKKPLDYTINCECYGENARKHFRGSVSMALKGRDTGDSQFFITHMPTYWLNEEVRPESVHTVFGRVVKGMEVIDRTKQGDEIISAKVLFKRNHEYKPKTVPNSKNAES